MFKICINVFACHEVLVALPDTVFQEYQICKRASSSRAEPSQE